MRFLADENFPGDAVTALRAAGHGVLWIRTDAPGITDQDVLARSLEDARVLLTFDKDFGELAWRSGLPASCGIVLFRLPALDPAGVGKVIADVLTSRDDWPGHFSVVEAWPDSGARAPHTRDATVDGKPEIGLVFATAATHDCRFAAFYRLSRPFCDAVTYRQSLLLRDHHSQRLAPKYIDQDRDAGRYRVASAC